MFVDAVLCFVLPHRVMAWYGAQDGVLHGSVLGVQASHTLTTTRSCLAGDSSELSQALSSTT